MEFSRAPSADTASPQPGLRPDSVPERTAELASLLAQVETPPPPLRSEPTESAYDNKLVQVRLGLASSLFTALRAKHAPTAAHSLRVALGCSAWALALNLPDEFRDSLEVAALLHDIGKIGVSDAILTKPTSLTTDELLEVARQRRHAAEILATCSASPTIMEIVHYSNAWYDGGKPGYDRRTDDLPLGARIVAIVDAFDAMTTDQVYRRAMSRDRALAELFAYAGTQFDPELVREYCVLQSGDQLPLHARVMRRWLKDLNDRQSNQLWALGSSGGSSGTEQCIDAMFHDRLVEHMHDGIMFVDSHLQIILWNRGLERLTGIAPASIVQHRWSPEIVQLADERNRLIDDETCPVIQAVAGGTQSMRRMSLCDRDGKFLSVDMQVVPVVGPGGMKLGAAVLLHDATSEISLEQRLQTLHEKATRDQLTGVANRAEFDRVSQEFITQHLERGRPCALIISDIDFFKRINDQFGHQAGDDALISFASLLQRNCRQGDLVARYGGEEFVMLCADCDNPTATERAERIRLELSQIPQPVLNGAYMTSSFGVTELQEGDTPENFLRRADRGLLQAKESGRNCVVQLGGGLGGAKKKEEKEEGWFSWLFGEMPDLLLERNLVTYVPINLSLEKLRGFVADQGAQVDKVEEGHVVLRVDGSNLPNTRRTDDRAVPFMIELTFQEKRDHDPRRTGGAGEGRLATFIVCAIRPLNSRDRRRHDAIQRARQLLQSIKSYLMAQELEPESQPGAPVAEEKKEEGLSSFLKPFLGG